MTKKNKCTQKQQGSYKIEKYDHQCYPALHIMYAWNGMVQMAASSSYAFALNEYIGFLLYLFVLWAVSCIVTEHWVMSSTVTEY